LLSKKYREGDDESAYADPGLGKQEYIGDPAQTLITLTEGHASGGPRSQAGSQFEKHAVLTQEEREKGYRSRIGVVPLGSQNDQVKSAFEGRSKGSGGRSFSS
jgi:hypothetical protein